MSFLRKRSRSPESFLIINTFGIGDVLFSTPLLRNLAQNFPEARFYYMANRKTADLLANHPLIKKVFVYQRSEFVAETKRSRWRGMIKYVKFVFDIRREKIDVAVDLSLNTPFSLIAMLGGIKRRIGLDYRKRGLFLTEKLPIQGFDDKHVAEYYLDVLKLMDIVPNDLPMEVYADEKSRKAAYDFFFGTGIQKGDLVIGIAPCGGDAFGKDACIKRWPAENFSGLIARLCSELKARVFIFAGPKEKEDVVGIIAGLKAGTGVYEFCDRTLPETVALLEKCDLFIGNDTGPLRFADALNKKIIALFGPVDDKVYGPYPFQDKRTIVLKKDISCRPCYGKFRLSPCVNDKKCLREITVDEVFDAVSRLLTEKRI